MPDETRNPNLPLVLEPNRPAAYRLRPNPAPEIEPEEPSVLLSHYLWILNRHRWRMLGFVFASVVATLVISSRITPVYESTVTVDVDRQAPSGVIGQEALRATANDADQFLATQIKLIQSDSVLRPVAQKFKLLEREKQFEAAANPARVENAPILLKKLMVARPPNTSLLLISYRSPDAHLAADVANAVANSYLEHTDYIRLRSSANLFSYMEKELEELKTKMEGSTERLLAFERQLNVINPEEKTSILSARLLQLNTEYTSAQADRVRKQAAYYSVRSGTLEAAQVSGQGEALKRLVERQNEAQERFAEVRVHFGANHPEYKKAAAQVTEVQQQLLETRQNIAQRVEIEYHESANREGMLASAVAQIKSEFDRLNARSFEYQTLKREAEGDKKLYEELIRKIKEARINARFHSSAIRIADLARPGSKPVFPNVAVNLVVAFLLSTLLAAGAAFLSDLLDKTIRDPEQVTRTLNAVVVACLPAVKSWRGRLGPASSKAPETALVRLCDSGDPSVIGYGEAIRTLRNSILLADFDHRIHSLLVTSASPGEGKSTIAAHLALAHAGQRHKTLLIDGDLRRPSVHKRFNIPGALGLSNVLVFQLSWRDALLKPVDLPELDILPAGPPSRQASDLIGPHLVELLEEAANEYDLIVLDAPPMLCFAEPLQMATAVDAVIIVTRVGNTNRRAVASALSLLERLRAHTLGVVLNEVHEHMSENYYPYDHHRKYYDGAQPNGRS